MQGKKPKKTRKKHVFFPKKTRNEKNVFFHNPKNTSNTYYNKLKKYLYLTSLNLSQKVPQKVNI